MQFVNSGCAFFFSWLRLVQPASISPLLREESHLHLCRHFMTLISANSSFDGFLFAYLRQQFAAGFLKAFQSKHGRH